ncbi:MAG: TetR/AcrR family transcriptional regulator [Actinomycetes bacterium]
MPQTQSHPTTPPNARTGRRRTRSTAAERRRELIEVARAHFAERGYFGTPTLAIAEDAGISQAYLFRLFPTKQDLFAACVERCIALTNDAFEAGAAKPLAGESPLEAMGRAYRDLLSSDPAVLLGQLHANAAAPREPKIREAIRSGWADLYSTVERISGAQPEEIKAFFAHGMLLNVVAAVGFNEINEPWAIALGRQEQDC